MTAEMNMTGRQVLVSGATGGIGWETARQLANAGARVWIIGRDAEKAKRVLRDQAAAGMPFAGAFTADLSRQAEIRRAAREIRDSLGHLDVLVNNAGAVFNSCQLTSEGFERTFALNHLGYFVLTAEMLPLLMKGKSVRIVNVSSAAHYMGKVDFNQLETCGRYSGFRAYSTSKLMNLYFTYELARRLKDSGISVNALHPGYVASNFGVSNDDWTRPFFKLSAKLAVPVAEGAKTSIYLASSPDVDGKTGGYYAHCRQVPSSRSSYHRATAARLWDETQRLTGAFQLSVSG
jgi:NAD(P)-dependent dehydrogenase (short-subunit alcohol dehydrogenase family)